MPARANPLEGLEPMPPREGLLAAVQPLWDVMDQHRRKELSLESCDDYTKAGEAARDALSNDGDAELVTMVKRTAERFTKVGHGFDMATAVWAVRPDLLAHGPPLRRGFEKLDNDVRDQLTAQGLLGYNFTHTEVKQGAKAVALMSEPELRAKSETNALNKVRVFKALKTQEAAASDRLVDSHRNQVEIWQAKLDAEAARGDSLRGEVQGIWESALEVRRVHQPVVESRRKRASEMTYGLLLQPNKKAAHQAAGKSSPGTQRDRGLLVAMQLDNESIVSDVRFDRVVNGFLGLAKGNVQAQTLAAVNTMANQSVAQLKAVGKAGIDALKAQLAKVEQAMQADAAAAAAAAAPPPPAAQ